MSSLTLTIVVLSVATALMFLCFGRKKGSKSSLQKPKHKKDMIYLIQFPPSSHIRTISPFALKLETFLRLHKIPYENIYTTQPSKKGQIPYIEFNGEQIPDSNVIIKMLEKRFQIDTKISQEEEAIAHSVKRMVENHTAIIGFYWRYGFNNDEFFEKLVKNSFSISRIGAFFFRMFHPLKLRVRAYLHGIGRHEMNEVMEFGQEDMDCISTLLGEKKFLFGDEMDTLDCVLFGQLVQFVLLPMEIPLKKYISQNCSNLEEYVERIQNKCWPDWDEMCSNKCMGR